MKIAAIIGLAFCIFMMGYWLADMHYRHALIEKLVGPLVPAPAPEIGDTFDKLMRRATTMNEQWFETCKIASAMIQDNRPGEALCIKIYEIYQPVFREEPR